MIALSTTNDCRTPCSSCGRCQARGQRECYDHGALPRFCRGVSRFGKDLSHTMIRVCGGKTGPSRDQLNEPVMIVFGKIASAKALFEYPAGLSAGLRVWRLRAILRPQ